MLSQFHLRSEEAHNDTCRLGGLCGAIVTSPFDVVKTRLQSSLFRENAVGVVGGSSSGTLVASAPRPGGLLYNFVETGHILRFVKVGALEVTGS